VHNKRDFKTIYLWPILESPIHFLTFRKSFEIMSRIFAVLAFILLFSLSGFSQSLASSSTDDSSSLLGLGSSNWSFFHNSEDQTIYIDFATIDVNLFEVKLLDEKGEVIHSEPLYDLPVDAIYELDLKGLESGDYTVELQSFGSDILKRRLKI